MMNPTRKAVAALSFLALTGCLGGFAKLPGAAAPVATTDDFATLSACATFQVYQASAEPALQRNCMSCHASGGRGSGKLQLTQGTSDNEIIAGNYATIVAKAAPDAGVAGDIDSTVPLLAYLNGSRSHDLNLGVQSADYAAIREWVAGEIEAPCATSP